MLTPGISTGYWKARKTPSRARSSADKSSRFFPSESDRAGGHFVGVAAGQHLRQRAFSRAVLAHDGVNLAGLDVEIDALENVLAAGGGDAGVQMVDFKQGHR